MAQEVPHVPPESAVAGSFDEMLREYNEVTLRLQRTHEALQVEIGRLRRELASKDRELELRRRLSALGELAAGVAHEVRNPLGAIQLYSDLLRNKCREHNLEPALQLIEKIEVGIQAIDAVVQDTLALAPRDRKLGAVPVVEVVQRARDAVQQTLATREVRLMLELPEASMAVRADGDGLQRVLVNLIANAAEVSAPGAEVWLRVERTTDEQIALRVTDDGPGLADEVRERIFDPFFTTKERGTGLGLTIAHRLIAAYGGELHADNRPAGGAEFMVVLPIAEASASREQTNDNSRNFSAA